MQSPIHQRFIIGIKKHYILQIKIRFKKIKELNGKSKNGKVEILIDRSEKKESNGGCGNM